MGARFGVFREHMTLRSFFFTGTQDIRSEANFSFCLNPLTLFTCSWAVRYRMDGEVS